MKEILNSLNTPDEMSVILRTAGSDKSKTEIKRDYDYLYKLWQDIKNKTLQSIAPVLIHEENHVIKKAIRDNFSNDLQEIVIEGDEAYKLGKSFMKTLIPSKAALVKKYKNNTRNGPNTKPPRCLRFWSPSLSRRPSRPRHRTCFDTSSSQQCFANRNPKSRGTD